MNLVPVGYIRRMDDLGRIVVPRELRKNLVGMKEIHLNYL